MIAEPESAESVLNDDHSQTYHHGIGDSQMAIESETIAVEEGATDNGLEQVVGETHAPKDAEMVEHLANATEGVPGRNYR